MVFFLNRCLNFKFQYLHIPLSSTSRYNTTTTILPVLQAFIFLFTVSAVFAQDLYLEDFDLPSGTIVDNGATAWSRDISDADLVPTGYFETRINDDLTVFEASDLDGEAIWISEVIDISVVSSVIVSIEVAEDGTMEGNDYLSLYYRLNEGPEIIFADFKNDFGPDFLEVFTPVLSGSELQIIIKVRNNDIGEVHRFDNVRVSDSSGGGAALYSRADRNWNHQNAWSLLGFTGASCHCTPDASSRVIIGSDHSINLNTSATVASLTIQDAGNLGSNGTHDLSITGDFSITSSHPDPFALGPQTVTFNGTGDQSVALNGESAFNLVVNKAGGKVSLDQPLNLTGVLDIQSPTEFISNGNLVITSSSDGITDNASIGTIANGGSVTGNVTVQRFISGEGIIYRYISSPVTNATVADWQDDFPITGTFSDPSTVDGFDSSNPSLFVYGESNSGENKQLGWMAFPSSGAAADHAIIPGAGYAALMLNGSNPTLIEVTGPINQGDFEFNVSFAGSGWNLLGNPYPATIDWSASPGWAGTDVANAIYIRNNENGNENSIVSSFIDGIGTNGGNGLVATGQSFWVQAIGSNPELQINERAKTGSTGAFLRKAQPDNWFKITLKNQSQYDETVVRFSSQATHGYDVKLDAKKFYNGGINIATYLDNQEVMVINSIPELLDDQQKLPILLNNTPPGAYQFFFAGLAGLHLPYAIALVDHYTGQTMEIADSTSYSFSIDTTRASFDYRFELLIKPSENVQQPQYFAAYPNPFWNHLNLDLFTYPERRVMVQFYDTLGNLLFDKKLNADRQTSLQLDMTRFQPGIYFIRMTSGSGQEHRTLKVLKLD